MRRQAPHPEPKWSVRLAYPTVAVSLDAALQPPGNIGFTLESRLSHMRNAEAERSRGRPWPPFL
jgi:hypothetical protein